MILVVPYDIVMRNGRPTLLLFAQNRSIIIVHFSHNYCCQNFNLFSKLAQAIKFPILLLNGVWFGREGWFWPTCVMNRRDWKLTCAWYVPLNSYSRFRLVIWKLFICNYALMLSHIFKAIFPHSFLVFMGSRQHHALSLSGKCQMHQIVIHSSKSVFFLVN